MGQNEREQFCVFFRGSRYDIIQGRKHDGWGPIFTFSPCNAHAAQNAGQMMRRMHQGEQLLLRYTRHARLRDRHRQDTMDVVVVTELPERVQVVFGMEDGVVLRVDLFLQDEVLAVLEAAVGL